MSVLCRARLVVGDGVQEKESKARPGSKESPRGYGKTWKVLFTIFIDAPIVLSVRYELR